MTNIISDTLFAMAVLLVILIIYCGVLGVVAAFMLFTHQVRNLVKLAEKCKRTHK